VNIPSVINLDDFRGGRWPPIFISRKMTGFSYLFASRISHTSTKHTSRVFQSLGGTKWSLLIPVPCSSCIFLSFHNCIDNLSRCRSNSSATSTKPSDSPRIIVIEHGKKPVQLFVISQNYALSERWWCVATVIGRPLPQFILMYVNLNSQNDNVDPQGDTIPHSLT